MLSVNSQVLVGMGCSSAPVAATVGDRALMMQHAVYIHLDPVSDASSIISGSQYHQLSSGQALHLGLVDEVLPEPPGAAHRDAAATFPVLRTAITHHLKELQEVEEGSLVRQRRKRLQVSVEKQAHLSCFFLRDCSDT